MTIHEQPIEPQQPGPKLAVIRVPSEEEEQRRHIHRQREALVRTRTKLQAQGRSLLVNHGQGPPA